MKGKYRFILIIILMAVALLGLVAIQTYWIRSVIVERTAEFEENANRALGQIARQLEEEEGEYLLSRFAGLKDFISPTYRQTTANYIGTIPGRNEAFSVQQSVLEETFTIPLNKLISSRKDSFQIRNYVSRISTIPLYTEGSTNNPNYSLHYGWRDENVLTDILRTQAGVIGDQTPIHQRIDPQRLTRLIDQVLTERYINIRYQYGILTDGELSSIHSEQWDENQWAFHTEIFPNRYGHAHYELVLRFPRVMNFVVRSMVPMIAASVLFVLFIIGVFAAAIYYMVRQKKVTDMKYDFINNMTHEFKTPIATISIAADALNSPRINTDAGKVEHYASIIKQENRRMLAQVESVLRIARLERGQMDLNRTPSDLNALLEEALEHIELIVADRQGTIDERFEAEKTTARVDKMHIINIFLNILDNANKYSPGQPEIAVRTYNTPDGKYWAVAISDKGMGMSKSEMKKIFESFYRIPTGDIHNIKGHGLGLAYSKKIVELHGGTIEVESSLGHGSTFVVKLPLD